MAETLHEEQIRQKPSPLPPLPQADVLTPEQWSILTAIADTVVPSLTPLEGNRLLQHPLRSDIYAASRKRLEQLAQLREDDGLVASYLGESATSQLEFRHSISRLVNSYLHEEARKGLLLILNALK